MVGAAIAALFVKSALTVLNLFEELHKLKSEQRLSCSKVNNT